MNGWTTSGIAIFLFLMHPLSLRTDEQTIKDLGGKFNHGYTLNEYEFLSIGPEWTGGDNGLQTLIDLQQTHGVTLSNMKIGSAGLKAIAAMPKLQSLNIEAAAIADGDWKLLESMKNLTSISISANQLTSVRLHGLKHLRDISVENAKAMTAFEATDLPELKSINLYCEGRPNIVTFTMSGLPKLQDFSISGFRVDGLRLGEFTTLADLTIFTTEWEKPEESVLTGLTNLQKVRLQDGHITNEQIAALRNNAGLKSVEIHAHHAHDDVFSALSDLQNLRELDIWSDSMTDAVFAHFRNLSKLEHLSIMGRQITGKAFDAMGAMPSLTHLTLGQSAVDDEGLKHLKGLKSLSQLDVDSTKITNRALNEFRKTLPPASPGPGNP